MHSTVIHSAAHHCEGQRCDEQIDWIEQQAERRDRSQAEIIRAAVDLTRGEPSVLRDDTHQSDGREDQPEIDKGEEETLENALEGWRLGGTRRASGTPRERPRGP